MLWSIMMIGLLMLTNWGFMVSWTLVLILLGIVMNSFRYEWRHLCSRKLLRMLIVRDCCQLEFDLLCVWNVNTSLVMHGTIEVWIGVYSILLLWRNKFELVLPLIAFLLELRLVSEWGRVCMVRRCWLASGTVRAYPMMVHLCGWSQRLTICSCIVEHNTAVRLSLNLTLWALLTCVEFMV